MQSNPARPAPLFVSNPAAYAGSYEPQRVKNVAAKVLFFGQDTRQCIPVLKRAGYSVDVYASVVEMRPSVFDDPDAAAVAISATWEPFLRDPISIARHHTTIPFILFEGAGEGPAQSIFDLVVPARRAPSQWLGELDLLIRECWATRAQARRVMAASDLLHKQSQAALGQLRLDRERSRVERESAQVAREHSRLERERSRRERSRSIVDMAGRWDLEGIPGFAGFANTPPVCSACEQRDRLNWSIMVAVAKLTSLLLKVTKAGLDVEASEHLIALRDEEKSLAADLEALLMQWKAHRASHGC
jgi:hypothetical protein